MLTGAGACPTAAAMPGAPFAVGVLRCGARQLNAEGNGEAGEAGSADLEEGPEAHG